MSKNKPVCLVVLHSSKIHYPSVSDLVSDPVYADEVRESLHGVTNKKDVAKRLKKISIKHARKIRVEQVMISDSVNDNMMRSASLIFEVETAKVLKNRLEGENINFVMASLMEKHSKDITNFFKQYRKNDE